MRNIVLLLGSLLMLAACANTQPAGDPGIETGGQHAPACQNTSGGCK